LALAFGDCRSGGYVARHDIFLRSLVLQADISAAQSTDRAAVCRCGDVFSRLDSADGYHVSVGAGMLQIIIVMGISGGINTSRVIRSAYRIEREYVYTGG